MSHKASKPVKKPQKHTETVHKVTAHTLLLVFSLSLSLRVFLLCVFLFLWDVHRQHFSLTASESSLRYRSLRCRQTVAALMLNLIPPNRGRLPARTGLVFMGRWGRMFSFSQFLFHPCGRQLLPHCQAFSVPDCHKSTLWPRGGFTVPSDG